MNLSLGVYDIFATAIPGSLYLLAGVYVSIRFGWLDADDLLGIDTTVAIIGVVLASYLLGQILGPGLRKLVEQVPWWRASSEPASPRPHRPPESQPQGASAISPRSEAPARCPPRPIAESASSRVQGLFMFS